MLDWRAVLIGCGPTGSFLPRGRAALCVPRTPERELKSSCDHCPSLIQLAWNNQWSFNFHKNGDQFQVFSHLLSNHLNPSVWVPLAFKTRVEIPEEISHMYAATNCYKSEVDVFIVHELPLAKDLKFCLNSANFYVFLADYCLKVYKWIKVITKPVVRHGWHWVPSAVPNALGT